MLTVLKPSMCDECAFEHDPSQPHNQQSLYYQINFYVKHRRLPTWADAMAHCSDRIKSLWTESLEKRGIDTGRRNDYA
jgi:hypothetical protein